MVTGLCGVVRGAGRSTRWPGPLAASARVPGWWLAPRRPGERKGAVPAATFPGMAAFPAHISSSEGVLAKRAGCEASWYLSQLYSAWLCHSRDLAGYVLGDVDIAVCLFVLLSGRMLAASFLGDHYHGGPVPYTPLTSLSELTKV